MPVGARHGIPSVYESLPCICEEAAPLLCVSWVCSKLPLLSLLPCAEEEGQTGHPHESQVMGSAQSVGYYLQCRYNTHNSHLPPEAAHDPRILWPLHAAEYALESYVSSA